MAFVRINTVKEFFQGLKGDYYYKDEYSTLYKTSSDGNYYLYISRNNTAVIAFRSVQGNKVYQVSFIVTDRLYESLFEDITEPVTLISLTELLHNIMEKSKPDAKYSPIEDGFLISLLPDKDDEFKVEMVKVAKYLPEPIII